MTPEEKTSYQDLGATADDTIDLARAFYNALIDNPPPRRVERPRSGPWARMLMEAVTATAE